MAFNCEASEGETHYHVVGGPINYNGHGGPHLLECVPLWHKVGLRECRKYAFARARQARSDSYWAVPEKVTRFVEYKPVPALPDMELELQAVKVYAASEQARGDV